MKRDARVIPGPGYALSEKFLKGDYATMFNKDKLGKVSIPRAARHFDARSMAALNHVAI